MSEELSKYMLSNKTGFAGKHCIFCISQFNHLLTQFLRKSMQHQKEKIWFLDCGGEKKCSYILNLKIIIIFFLHQAISICGFQ